MKEPTSLRIFNSLISPTFASTDPQRNSPTPYMAALEAKLAGNVAFKAGNLPLALKSYSSAIELDPGVAVYYLNRSAVYLKQQRWSDVEADTTKAIQLDSKLLMKASFRRGIARREAGDLDGARGDFHIALTAGAAPAEVAAELDKIPKVRLFSQIAFVDLG